MSLTIFQNEKTPFQPLKTRRSKSRKIDIFPKGFTQGFGSKMDNFSSSVFQVIYARNMCFTIFQNEKNAFLGDKNKKFKKSKNCLFSKGINPWFWSKNGIFSTSFFLGKIGQENVFYDILERKNTFLGIKTRSLKSRKIPFFPKG